MLIQIQMVKVVRFLDNIRLTNPQNEEKLFYRNEEVEWISKESIWLPLESRMGYQYTLNDGYVVSDTYVMETNVYTNTGTDGESYQEKWGKYITEDEAMKRMGKNDYVKAAKDYLGVDIKPHDTADKADYANQSLLPKEYRRKK